MKFKNNQKLLKLLKLILTLKDKSIVQLLLKALCFISCVFLFASLIICINIRLKASLSSSSKLSKELLKKMKQELDFWFKTSDIQFINGYQEDFLKSINLFSYLWLHSDWWIKKLLMLLTLLKKWTFWLKVFQNQVFKTLLIGYLILLGIWFKHFLNFNNSKYSLKTCKKTLRQDLKIGITN